MSRLRLLSGPDLAAGSEALNAHVQRFGPLPAVGPGLFDSVERSGLTGRGGAAFPVARKWRAGSAAGGGGRLPTLVQNVETLAQVALIARYGADWFRSAGRRGAAGTILVTVAGAVSRSGVVEVEAGISVREVLELAGGATQQVRAVLLGGYFGSWVDASSAWDLPLDASMLRERGLTLGCGVVGFLPVTGCGVCETARIMEYLASESSAQCGPCFFGLRALATTSGWIAQGIADPGDLARLERWSREVRGRGACHHPDGAAGLLQSALTAFATEFQSHPAHMGSQVA